MKKPIKNIVSGITMLIIVFLISGCGEEVVKVIIVPAASGLSFMVIVFWLCVAYGIDSCDKQNQQRHNKQHNQQIMAERSANPKYATDMPSEVPISSKNYQRFSDLCSNCVPKLDITNEHNLKSKYRMFVKRNVVKNIDTEQWFEVSVKVLDMYGQGVKAMTFHTNELKDQYGLDELYAYKIVITWEPKTPETKKEVIVDEWTVEEQEVQKKPEVKQKRHYVDDYRDNSMYQ